MNHSSADWCIPRASLLENADTKWTHCPRPYNDESFSSWFARLAKANCADPLPLYYTLIEKQRPFKDIEHDVSVKSSLMKALGERVEIDSMAFNEFQIYGQQGENKVNEKDYLNSILNFPRYCPLCFANDDDPYFRYIWQLPFVCVCPVHHILLLDRCPSCYNPVHYWRTGWDKPVCVCFKCGNNLMKNYRFLSRPNNHVDLRFQETLVEIYEKGSYQGEKLKRKPFFQSLWINAVKECPVINKEEPLSGLTTEILYHGLLLSFGKFTEDPEAFFAIQVNDIEKPVEAKVIAVKRDGFDRKPLPDIKESELEVAEQRYQVILPYINDTNRTAEEAIHVAETAGVSLSTLYRWLGYYKEGGYTALAPRRRLGGRHRNKFPHEVEAIMAAKIKGNITRPDPVSKHQCWVDFSESLTQLGYELVEIPSRYTFSSRYLEILEKFG
jgi:hypothetical protein